MKIQPKLLGYHLNAYPNQRIKDIFKKKSLLKSIKELGYIVTGANAYSKEYFDYVENTKHIHYTCSTVMIMESAIPFRLENDLRNGNAIYQDLTNIGFKEFGYDVPIVTPEKSADNLLNLCKKNDFVFFEYFQTDKAGHSLNPEHIKQKTKTY